MKRSAHAVELETANEQFKRGFARWFWGGLILATFLHALLFYATPTFSTENIGFSADELSVLDIPDEIRIPPPPQAVPRPAAPVVVADARLEDQDMTIPPTTLESNPVENLPPPPSSRARDEEDLAAAPVFTPMTVRPTLKNPGEVTEALGRHYPTLLREAGIGGRVNVWFFIDETGHVVKTQLHQSSGYDAFDDAAMRVADLMDFTPAYNRDERVRVWVSIPILFEVR